jgi:hypothetical protein
MMTAFAVNRLLEAGVTRDRLDGIASFAAGTSLAAALGA